MSQKVIFLNSRRAGLNTMAKYMELLASLKEQEQKMTNPLLKDWFKIRNEIRALEKKIREMRNGKID